MCFATWERLNNMAKMCFDTGKELNNMAKCVPLLGNK